jgi:hypothetical protein
MRVEIFSGKWLNPFIKIQSNPCKQRYSIMKMRNFLKTASLLGILTLTVFSCRRENDEKESGTAADNSLAEQTFDDVKSIADQAADGNLTSYKTGGLLSVCATVTHDTLSDPRMLTIDFGTVNCLCNDGRNRRGKILVSYSGRYKDQGSVHTITFDKYYVNDNHVMGSKIVTNEGPDGNGNIYYTVVIDGSIGLADSSGTLTFVSNRTRTWVAGYSTPEWMDDAYEITGTASGTRPDGGSFSAEIITPLRKEISCRWIVSGVMEFTPGDKPTRTIDFGNGDCDDQAVVSIGNWTRTITLR